MKQVFFFSHQAQVTVGINANDRAVLGNVPQVRVDMFNDNGELTPQEVPVRKIVNDELETTSIVVVTSNKNGIVTIG